jgi:hypothetical protein
VASFCQDGKDLYGSVRCSQIIEAERLLAASEEVHSMQLDILLFGWLIRQFFIYLFS